MEASLADKLIRNVWFSRNVPLSGSYRYRDVFQLMPAPPPTNDPGMIMRHYPLILELQYDTRIWTERDADLWCRDAWERERERALQMKAKGSPGQNESYEQISGDSGVAHFWFITRTDTVPVWGQTAYPVPELSDAPDSFSAPAGEQVNMVPFDTYYKRTTRDVISAGSRKETIEFPDILDELLGRYFSLDPDAKCSFYRASLLWVQANALGSWSSSLALVAAVSAIETLVHFADPEPERCSQCGSLLGSEPPCGKCGAPTYGLTRQFKDFIEKHGGSKSFADRMYAVRSNVAHRGALLRADLFDTGFHAGGEDEQMFFSMDASRTTRGVIVNWLRAR